MQYGCKVINDQKTSPKHSPKHGLKKHVPNIARIKHGFVELVMILLL